MPTAVVLSVLSMLAPSSAGDAERAATETEPNDVHGPAPFVATEADAPTFRWLGPPRLGPNGSPQWFEVASWSAGRSRLSILGKAQIVGAVEGFPGLRVDGIESGLGLAWSPRSSWFSFFVALRATSAAVGGDAEATGVSVGPMGGVVLTPPPLVELVRRWRARPSYSRR